MLDSVLDSRTDSESLAVPTNHSQGTRAASAPDNVLPSRSRVKDASPFRSDRPKDGELNVRIIDSQPRCERPKAYDECSTVPAICGTAGHLADVDAAATPRIDH